MTKRTLPICFVLAALAVAPAAAAMPPAGTDEKAIRAIIADYVQGWREADPKRLSRVFALEEGRVLWLAERSGKQVLASRTFEKILQRPRKAQPEYGLEWEVLDLDVIDGKLASAKVRISRRGGSYIDLLLLHKIEDEWRIVTKTFVSRSAAVGSQGTQPR